MADRRRQAEPAPAEPQTPAPDLAAAATAIGDFWARFGRGLAAVSEAVAQWPALEAHARELETRRDQLAAAVARLEEQHADATHALGQTTADLSLAKSNAARDLAKLASDLDMARQANAEAVAAMARELTVLSQEAAERHAIEVSRREQEIADLEERRAALRADLEVIARRAAVPA